MDIDKKGIFVISLDFELYWGVSESRKLSDYKENLVNVPKVIKKLLSLFKQYEIHATWATVGFLFHKNKEEMGSLVEPKDRPNYSNANLSNYSIIKNIGNNELEDPFHYASSIINEIKAASYQEIATHTYSHYYCLEQGQNSYNFEMDLKAAITLGKKYGVEFSSIIFPRNQYTEDVLQICHSNGIVSYRGTEEHWIYATRSRRDETTVRRILRLIDAYFNITPKNTFKIKNDRGKLVNIPSSRFLRPYSINFSFIESIRLNRIKREMDLAAQHGEVYHLWWHPHNFGKNMDENINFLKGILDHYAHLNHSNKMISKNMKEITE